MTDQGPTKDQLYEALDEITTSARHGVFEQPRDYFVGSTAEWAEMSKLVRMLADALGVEVPQDARG